MPTLSIAPREVQRLLTEVMDTHQPDLARAEVSVQALCASADRDDNGNIQGPAIKEHGFAVLGKVKVNSCQDRIEGKADATITIDWDRWPDLPDDERTALLDRLLEHLVLTSAFDGAGRPKLRTRPGDFRLTGFWSIVARHGAAAPESQGYKEINRVFSQQLFPWG